MLRRVAIGLGLTALVCSTAYAATGSIGLTDVSGLRYYINTNITFSTSSSASGAESEASYVQAVAVTSSAGGYVASTLNDEFDGYNAMCIWNTPFVAGTDSALECQTGNARFTMYEKNGASPTTELNGRQLVFPVQHTSIGVDMFRKVFVPENDEFTRWMNVFTNTGSSDVTFTMAVGNNLGSDSNTKITGSSGAGASPIIDTSTTWVATFQNYSGTTSSDVRTGQVMQGVGAPVGLVFLNFTDGDDNPKWGYNITLHGGETAIIVNFVTGQRTKALAAAQATALATGSGTALQGMTHEEISQVINFNLTCPSVRDQCNDVSTDGSCTAVPLQNTACNDGNACTTVDRCVHGACVGAIPATCAPSGACSSATCDPSSGCVNTPINDGGSCNDSNTCTDNDVCTSGTCAGTPNTANHCDDGNACTDDVCNGSGGCTSTVNSSTGACDDHNPCTDDVCNGSGTCVGTPNAANHCDDKNDCTDDACNGSGACVNTPNAKQTCNDGTCTPGLCVSGRCFVDVVDGNDTTCSVGDACQANDTCFIGHCLAEPRDCSTSPDACTTGMCTPGVGCQGVARTTGTCNDSDPCTLTDTCSASGCSGTPMDCTALDGVCMVGQCNGGTCAAVAAADGTTCDDGNADTKGDHCVNGACAAGTKKGGGGCAATGADSMSAFAALLALAFGMSRARRRR